MGGSFVTFYLLLVNCNRISSFDSFFSPIKFSNGSDGQRRESWLDPPWRWPLFSFAQIIVKSFRSWPEWNGRRKMQCGNISAMSERGRTFTRPSKEGLQLRLPFGHSLLVGMNVRRGGPSLRPRSVRLSAAGIQMLQTSFSPPPPSVLLSFLILGA